MKRIFLASVLISIFALSASQTTPGISKPIPSFNNKILTVKYDITGCGSSEFVDITLILVNSKGDTLKPRYITGDIGRMVSCGLGKRIDWNLENDKITMDEDLEIVLKGVKSVPSGVASLVEATNKTRRGNVILSSVIIPGLGQKKASGNSAHLIFSGVVYGGLGATVFFLLKASDYKVKYNNASGTLRDEMFDKWQKNYDMSKVFGLGTAGAWAVNVLWSSVIPIKVIPEQEVQVSFSAPYNDGLLISAKWNF